MKVRYAGGSFSGAHERARRNLPDLAELRPDTLEPGLLARARSTWRHRVTTEFRSIQIMTRFLTEVVSAGDPLDVYSGALELIGPEVFHTELCSAVCSALGTEPELPEPTLLAESPDFLEAPMAERALTTAITMLAISETISTAFIVDLAERCQHPCFRAVLAAMTQHEDAHGEFGWNYARESLRRFPPSALADFRHLVRATLARYEDGAHRALRNVPAAEQELAACVEQELADLGLLSPRREALLYFRTRDRDVVPKLVALDLLTVRKSPDSARAS
jgi:hypothetical protein